jgi:predicted ATPase/transcriptional regulator with XRE-family HTH domain
MQDQLNVQPQATTTFGARLRVFRARAGLTQEALAERAGLGVATLKALERDQRQRPHPRTVAQLADALGLGPAEREALLDSTAAGEPALDAPSPPVAETLPPDETADDVPPPEAGGVEARRLPVWLTSFVGREVEIETVRGLLDPAGSAVRLLTLLGPGGVGKTRLAVTAAAPLADAFADGVVFVDLAPLSDPRLVPATVARAVGVREGGGRSARDLLIDHLSSRQMLLVLDNFEHVLSAAPLLAELLQECGQVALLATSRIALRLRAERRLQVGPLATPPDDAGSPDSLAAPSVRLFVERARAVAPNFVLDANNSAAVAAVCRRLEGIPLAIELAAARAGLLQPAALLQRLERRLPLLTRGAADLPERQQTLRHTLAWSHGLLGPAEQVLFRRLAVFAGGCTLEAAEKVCLLESEPTDDVLDRFAVLVDNCLVYQTVGPDQEPRFAMLETVREYAEERLVENDEVEATRRIHAGFYLELAERAAPELPGPHQAAWLERLERDHANLNAALDWLTERREWDLALRLATSATWYWLRRSYFTDARRVFGLLNSTQGQRGAMRATALLAAARIASSQGDYDGQARYDAEGLDLFREAGDLGGTANAVTDLGVAKWQQGHLDEAEVYLLEGLQLFRTLEDPIGIATALLPLACVTRDRGDFAGARPLYAEALLMRRGTSDQLGIAHVLNNMGWLEFYDGQLTAARGLVEESLAIRRALGSHREAGVSQTLLGKVAMLEGDRSSAGSLFRESLQVHAAVGNRWGVALALEGVAALAAIAQPEQALRLAGAAAALRAAIGRRLPPVEQPLVAGWLAPARTALSEAAVARMWAEGEALSEAQAVAAALEVATSLTAE